ncbi:MAG: SHOCT domain-containing protein [Ilumatobacter sp.]|nr:MAG: SHOCT domain-containing protein [Ilumatobacter sp.]
MRRRGVGRGGRPGLLGTAARTAVVVKTADAVASNSAAKRQARAAAAAPAAPAAPATPAPAPPPPAAPAGGLTDDVVDQLKKLAELRDAGILTEDEFGAKKAKLLGI